MPYDLKEVAAISGMPGLYRLVRPTRAGVIVETLDERATRSVASARNKVSLLHEISIYTQDYDQTVPLAEVFDRVRQHYGDDFSLSNKSDDRDLTAFMETVVPDYDRQRVYMSDIKKLVTWYRLVSTALPHDAAPDAEAPAALAADTEESADDQAKPKAKTPKAKAAAADEKAESDDDDAKPKARSRKKAE